MGTQTVDEGSGSAAMTFVESIEDILLINFYNLYMAVMRHVYKLNLSPELLLNICDSCILLGLPQNIKPLNQLYI